jgi:hypothetical protein
MIRVRFPNGQCIRYNDATTHRVGADGTVEILREAEDRTYWVAIIPKATPCLLEYMTPCAVENPIRPEMKAESCLAEVMVHLRTLPGYRLRDLKNALRDFNARSHCWKTIS